MALSFTEENDRIHVFTDGIEWTILKKFAQERGPCYISDVRTAKKRLLVDDNAPDNLTHHSLNVTTRGGLWGFGLVACYPEEYDFKNYHPEDFWRMGWELTTRLKGTDFGISYPRVGKPFLYNSKTALSLQTNCHLNCKGQWIAKLRWNYIFQQSRVNCTFTLESVENFPGLYIKEPKVVASGLLGMKYMSVYDEDGKNLLDRYDLAQLTDPRRHTKQLPWPKRKYVIFYGDGWNWRIMCDRNQDVWWQDRCEQREMTEHGTPQYCYDRKGNLKSQWEVPKFKDSDRVGVLLHIDEGGYGAPDCLACFRPWPQKGIKYEWKLMASLNLGGKSLRPAS